jgi:hypothetical protein
MRDDERDQDDINLLLQRLDHPMPAVPVERVIARAAVKRSRWVSWAAGILLFVGLGGVAYAIPGSPVRGWFEAVVNGIRGTGKPLAGVVDSTVGGSATAVAGIAVDPGSELRIVFTHAVDSAVAHVTLIDGDQVTVRAPGNAATFTTDVARLIVDNSLSPVIYEIGIPRNAPRVEIRVAGRRVFVVEAGRLMGGLEEEKEYLVPLQ